MNKRIHPTLIGAFVVGALALVVIAVVIFGSGRLFRQTKEFVLYFNSSVNGLRVGAPVKFRGVEIGSVKNILLQLEPEMKIKAIPVIIEIDEKKVTQKGGQGAALSDPKTGKALIDQGLRGQLQMESFVTGLLYVGLDFIPGSPANFVQTREAKYQEIPTLPTALERAQDVATQVLVKLQEVDLKGLVEATTQAVDGISQLVNAPGFKSALRSLDRTMPKIDEAVASIRSLTSTVDDNVKTLSGDLQQTTAEARLAFKQASVAMQELEATVAGMQGSIGTDSPTFYELAKSLREVSAAARSLRLLANYLERNPRALIFGKPEVRGE
ncbi:MAG TPA: MlaD family protein [Candidatus Binatia bacterium]|jgi:paraquat-inducible protein B|nr:MlaD family protein [Candidatus Binatia bacterium]